MPDHGPAAPEVRRKAALMTEPSKASNIMECTGLDTLSISNQSEQQPGV